MSPMSLTMKLQMDTVNKGMITQREMQLRILENPIIMSQGEKLRVTLSWVASPNVV